jgi:hypothetical protein
VFCFPREVDLGAELIVPRPLCYVFQLHSYEFFVCNIISENRM